MYSKELKIGFLPVCLELIRNNTPNLLPEIDRRIKDIIVKRIRKFGKVVDPGLIFNIELGKKARTEFVKEDVDIIIIANMSYSSSEIPFSVIRGLGKPVIILNTSLIRSLQFRDTLVQMTAEHSFVGTTELTSLLKRIKYPHYYIVSGLMDRDSTYNKIAPYLEAARIVKVLSRSNIGFVGSTVYTGMLDIEVDETFLKDRFGVNIIHLKPSEISDTFSSISSAEIGKSKKALLKRYKNIDLTTKQFDDSVRMGITYQKLIDKYNLSSVANYCQSTLYDPRIGLPPCLGTTMCTSSGVPFSCEGDTGSAIALLIMQELTGNSTFTETYMLDYEREAILLGHCGQGNFNYARADEDVHIGVHPSFQDGKIIGASSNFSYREGKATLLNMSTDSGCNWKMVISTGKLSYIPPANLGVPQGWWSPGMDLDEFVEKWCSAGPSHHAALGYGDMADTLTKVGNLLELNVNIV